VPKDTQILLGDLSAKVGFENQARFGFGNCAVQEESNGDGSRLTGLASALNLPHKKIVEGVSPHN
jgi:hypothetical protein